MPVGGPYFSSVKKAREALKERANELLDLQISIIKSALAEGDFETAAKANQFLLEHIPHEDGERLLDTTVDKQQIESKAGPMINIGFKIGGVAQKELTPTTIEVAPIKPDDE